MRFLVALVPIGLLGSGAVLAPLFGQDVVSPKLASADLLADVAVLQRVYETAHPGLYRYNTKADMDRHFVALRAEFARDRTLAETYVVVSQFLAKVKCGHTYANFSNQDKAVAHALFAGKNRVPFCFRWIGGKMVVSRDLSTEHVLEPGTEILELNGTTAADLLTKLMTVGRADGANDAKRVASLEVRGTGSYEAFDVFLPLFYPKTRERLELLVLKPGAARPETVTVAAHGHDQRKALAGNKSQATTGTDPLWKFERLDDRVAYLRMPSWALYNSKWDWKAFLERGIDDLVDTRVPALVLDLRGNEGGLDVGNALIARLAAGDVRGDGYRRYTRYRAMPEALNGYLDTWDPSFRDWGKAAKEDRDGFFRLTRYDDDEAGTRIAPKGKRYEGRVVVLTDASNSSATFQFARAVKEHKLATLVGQTTGGNRRGINGGAFFFVRLPKSQIEVDLPLIATFAGDGRPTGKDVPFRDIPDAGIEPDVAVAPSIDDVVRGVDTELRAARELLKKNAP